MVTRNDEKNTSGADKSKQADNSDEKNTAGADQSKTQQTTKQAEDRENDQSNKVEERGETDSKAAASGGSPRCRSRW